MSSCFIFFSPVMCFRAGVHQQTTINAMQAKNFDTGTQLTMPAGAQPAFNPTKGFKNATYINKIAVAFLFCVLAVYRLILYLGWIIYIPFLLSSIKPIVKGLTESKLYIAKNLQEYLFTDRKLRLESHICSMFTSKHVSFRTF